MEDLNRLARYIRDRRERQLELTQTEFARRCGVTMKTIQRVEAGNGSTRPMALANLDRGARWVFGSSQTILNGGEPTPLTEPGWTDTALEGAAMLLVAVCDDPQEYAATYRMVCDEFRNDPDTLSAIDQRFLDLAGMRRG